MNRINQLASVVIAVFILWAAGAWFCNSHYTLVPQPELGGVSFPERSIIFWKSEGCGSSSFGQWGVSAITNIADRCEQKVMIWGDSYVEALQVDDQYKMAQQLTRLLGDNEQNDMLAVGAGLSGQSVADYLLKIPLYEARVESVAAHVIVIGQIEDLYPDQQSAQYAQFVSKPHLAILPAKKYPLSRLKWMIYKLGVQLKANGLLSVIRNCSDGLNLRFRMGPVKSPTKKVGKKVSISDMREYFGFYAEAFKTATNKQLILVYMPTIPRLEGNSWNTNDQDSDAAQCMEQTFSLHGWQVINMAEDFNQYYRSTGRLPRGFSNSRPGSGHLNEDGHRLVAEAIAELMP